MTPAAKKAFVARMAKARAAKSKKRPAPTKSRSKKTARIAPPIGRKKQAKKTNPARTKTGAFSIVQRGKGSNTYYQVIAPGTGKVLGQYGSRKDAATHLKALTAKANPKKRRANPADDMTEAETMYEQFHGRPANRTIEHGDSHDYRSELAELGKLLELRFHAAGGKAKVEGFKNCQVTCTPDGTNIYFLGGDQALNLEALDIASDKDYLELGECSYIRYFTHKGFHDFAPVEYFHTFGEEDGIRPVLAYDSVNKKLFLLGGNYQCKPEGIVN